MADEYMGEGPEFHQLPSRQLPLELQRAVGRQLETATKLESRGVGTWVLKPSIIECLKNKLGATYMEDDDEGLFDIFVLRNTALPATFQDMSLKIPYMYEFKFPEGTTRHFPTLAKEIQLAAAKTDPAFKRPSYVKFGDTFDKENKARSFMVQYGETLHIKVSAKSDGHMYILFNAAPYGAPYGTNAVGQTKKVIPVVLDMLRRTRRGQYGAEQVIYIHLEVEQFGNDEVNPGEIVGPTAAIVAKVYETLEECATTQRKALEPQLGKKVAQREVRRTLPVTQKYPLDIARHIGKFAATPKLNGGRKKTKKRTTRRKRV